MNKIVISLLLMTLAAIMAANWIIDSAFNQYTNINNDDFDNNHFQNLAAFINNESEPKLFLEKWIRSNNENTITLIDPSDLMLPPSLQNTLNKKGRIILESNEGITLYYSLPAHQSILAIEQSHKPLQVKKTQIFFTGAFYFFIFSMLLIWLIPLLTDLKKLRTATHAFGQGKLTYRITPSRFSHTKDIHSAFNTMAKKISQLLSDNKILSNALSHELKTPLARLRFGFDVLSEETNIEKKQHYTHRINEDLNEMQSIIDTLLEYARIDTPNTAVKKEAIDACALLEESIHAQWTESKRIEFFNKDQSVVNCDPKHLKLVLNNLIKNALLYSHYQVAIHTKVHTNEALLSIHIEDDGPGIAPEEFQQLVKPFIRGTQEKSGHGMGLAIVERVVTWNNWHVDVTKSTTLGGAHFCLNIPLSA